MTFSCWKCGETIQYPTGSRVGNRDACPKCDADLHACRNCQFYDPGKHNQCTENQAEWVRDKEAGNYCDYFSPGAVLYARGERPTSKADAAKRKFDSLFKI
jgi:hypothetical protein